MSVAISKPLPAQASYLGQPEVFATATLRRLAGILDAQTTLMHSAAYLVSQEAVRMLNTAALRNDLLPGEAPARVDYTQSPAIVIDKLRRYARTVSKPMSSTMETAATTLEKLVMTRVLSARTPQ